MAKTRVIDDISTPNCNTLITTGFHLNDLTGIKDAVYQAVKVHAASGGVSNFPDMFICSHCGNAHPLDPEEIRNTLFSGPGAFDFSATYDEFMAMINGAEATGNSVNVNSDLEISRILDPSSVFNDDTGLTPGIVTESITSGEADVNKSIAKGDSGS